MIKILFHISCVHYLLRGNTADIDFEDECSIVSELDSEDEDWLKELGFLSFIIIYN